MVLEYIKRSWETYRKNTISFIIAELISLLITGTIALVGIGIIFNFIGISSLKDLYNLEFFIRKIASLLSLLAEIAIALVLLFIACLARIFLSAGLYGMAAESLRGKINVNMLFQYSKKYGFKGIVSSIMIGIITLIFIILAFILNIFFSWVGIIVGVIIIFLMIVTFSLVFPGIILDGLSSINAIKESFNISKKNYLDILGLSLFYAVISLVILIPFLGILIYCLVISPMMKISLVFFYIRKK